jgi:hypothetical protein
MAREGIKEPDFSPDLLLKLLRQSGILPPETKRLRTRLYPDLPAFFCASYCLRCSDRILQKICSWLNETTHPAAADILSMLDTRSPERMELCIYLPFLSGVFSQTDEDSCYWNYLRTCIVSISSYQFLPFFYPERDTAGSRLLHLIRKRMQASRILFPKKPLPHEPEFILSVYEEYRGHDFHLLCGKQDALPSNFMTALVKTKEKRYDYRYDLSRISQQKDAYPDLVQMLTDPDGPWKKEFRDLRNYYTFIKKKGKRWKEIQTLLNEAE